MRGIGLCDEDVVRGYYGGIACDGCSLTFASER